MYSNYANSVANVIDEIMYKDSEGEILSQTVFNVLEAVMKYISTGSESNLEMDLISASARTVYTKASDTAYQAGVREGRLFAKHSEDARKEGHEEGYDYGYRMGSQDGRAKVIAAEVEYTKKEAEILPKGFRLGKQYIKDVYGTVCSCGCFEIDMEEVDEPTVEAL